jgi:epoxyqueuosine reductase
MSDPELAQALKTEAIRLGFDAVGIAPAVALPGHGRYMDWLDAGYAAGMDYLSRQAEARSHPDRVLEGVRAIVLVSVVYGRPTPQGTGPSRGRVARYAQGDDYHRALWDRLDALLDWVRAQRPEVRGRAVADTAPLLEREFARRAGLGWIGKNTMLIHRRLGSFTSLGALLLDCELPPDEPHLPNHCGTCTRCLDACPTAAFPQPYTLDANRCISYWTIEHRGPIPDAPADALHGWVFGCDVCQDVCPWNRKAPPASLPEFSPREAWTDPDLIAWLDRSPEAWRAALKGSATARAKRAGLVRNAALVLGAGRVAEAVPALSGRLLDAAEDPVVRQAAAWALERIGTTEARALLDGLAGVGGVEPGSGAERDETGPPR